MAKTYTKTRVKATEAMLLISKADRILAKDRPRTISVDQIHDLKLPHLPLLETLRLGLRSLGDPPPTFTIHLAPDSLPQLRKLVSNWPVIDPSDLWKIARLDYLILNQTDEATLRTVQALSTLTTLGVSLSEVTAHKYQTHIDPVPDFQHAIDSLHLKTVILTGDFEVTHLPKSVDE